MFKEFRLSALVTTGLMIVLGVLLFAKPMFSIKAICYIIATIFVLFALTRVYAFVQLRKERSGLAVGNIVLSLCSLIVGIFFFIKPMTLAAIIPIVLGILILADGIILLSTGIVFRTFLPKSGLGSILTGLLICVLSFLAITHPFHTQVVLMKFIGATLLICGIISAINHFMVEGAEVKREEAKTVNFTTEPNEVVPADAEAAEEGSGAAGER